MRHPTLEVGTILLALYGVMLHQSLAHTKGDFLGGNEGRAHRALSTSSTAGEGTIVGIRFLDSSDLGASDDSSESSVTMEGLIEASQANYNATVVGGVQIAEVLCETLVEAEGASSLTFTFSLGETIVADKAFYTEHSGDVFTDGLSRKVWAGTEEGIDPLQARRVTMTWAEECSAETFLLKLDTNNGDGTFTVVRTIPCNVGTDTNTCVLEVGVNAEDIPPPGEATPFTKTNKTSDGRRLQAETGRRVDLKNTIAGSKNLERQLQTTEQVDMLLFYTPEAMQELSFTSTAQMESYITDEMADVQIGIDNSLIDLNINVVRIEMLPYIETSTDAAEIRDTLSLNTEVATMRDLYGADLVHLITGPDIFLGDIQSCGIANLLMDSYIEDGTADQYAFGITAAGACFFINTLGHELGHNFGCWHDIVTLQEQDFFEQVSYYHGFRDCSAIISFGTIMAYGCPFVFFFYDYVNVYSTPELEYLGMPVGTVDREDCSRRIRETMSILGGYRTLSTATPAPTTPAPMTPSPSSVAPTEPAPLTPMPTTTAPTTVAPLSPLPTTSAPTISITSAPTTPDPTPTSTMTIPTTPEPSALPLDTRAPITLTPITPTPTLSTPSTSAPATSSFTTPSPVASTCSNGIVGVEKNGQCCVLGCGTCGGMGCSKRARDVGLKSTDCCVTRIRESGVYCDASKAAPCILNEGPTPEPSPTPQPAAPTETLVEAAERTTITVYANGFDERTSGSGCSPSGCVAANTRDGAPSTRWSCKEDLIDGKNCKITFEFDDAQDIVLMRVAFYKGDERTRKLKVIVNSSNLMTIESSGTTDELEMFALNTDKTKDLTLEALSLAGGEWISLVEVEFMVI